MHALFKNDFLLPRPKRKKHTHTQKGKEDPFSKDRFLGEVRTGLYWYTLVNLLRLGFDNLTLKQIHNDYVAYCEQNFKNHV